ncbi:hypothetical protein MKEN_01336000 [Mycena kentingensis (nom. inval.)]|nr:hypothetical protein MKEN_01336000 [Mycena kentingensis (nom. inval.)]
MSSIASFSNEVLLEILSHLTAAPEPQPYHGFDQRLKPKPRFADLRRVALANNNFNQLARTFLFADLHFSPYQLDSASSYVVTFYLPAEPERSARAERIAFWASESIAPLVRSITVRPGSRDEPCWGVWAYDTAIGVHGLRDLFFERAAAFGRIKHMDVWAITFTSNALSTLEAMAQTNHFSLHTDGKSVPAWFNLS